MKKNIYVTRFNMMHLIIRRFDLVNGFYPEFDQIMFVQFKIRNVSMGFNGKNGFSNIKNSWSTQTSHV